MISQQGRVIALDGDDAVVNIGGVSGCPACDAGKGCGAGIFGRLLRDRKVDIRVANSIRALNGQTVNLGISEEKFLRMVFALYAWPLLAGLMGIVLAFLAAGWLGLSDFLADLSGLISGIAAAAWALFRSRKKLREFPGLGEVHLLDTAVAKEECSSGTAERKFSVTQNNDLNTER